MGEPLKIFRELQGLNSLESCTKLTQNMVKFAPISFREVGSQREARARRGVRSQCSHSINEIHF